MWNLKSSTVPGIAESLDMMKKKTIYKIHESGSLYDIQNKYTLWNFFSLEIKSLWQEKLYPKISINIYIPRKDISTFPRSRSLVETQ